MTNAPLTKMTTLYIDPRNARFVAEGEGTLPVRRKVHRTLCMDGVVRYRSVTRIVEV